VGRVALGEVTDEGAHDHVFQAERNNDRIVCLGRPNRDPKIALHDAASQVQAQGAQSPIIDIYRLRFIVVQVHQLNIVGTRQRIIAQEAKCVGCRFYGWTFGDSEGAIVARSYKVKDCPHSIYMGTGQWIAAHDKIRLDQYMLFGGEVYVRSE
jgi:hypothetical protein